MIPGTLSLSPSHPQGQPAVEREIWGPLWGDLSPLWVVTVTPGREERSAIDLRSEPLVHGSPLLLPDLGCAWWHRDLVYEG